MKPLGRANEKVECGCVKRKIFYSKRKEESVEKVEKEGKKKGRKKRKGGK